MPTPIKAIITGATGMVGEGVLHECLNHPLVEAVLVINRKPCGVIHTKLKEIIHTDFFDLSPFREKLGGYTACFFCLGISSVGVKEADYYRMTYTLTMHVADTLVELNPGMSFCYISGAGTDSSAKGRSMWAKVKGKTENHLLMMSFKAVYCFRPGFIKPTPGLKNTLKLYRYLGWLFPIGRALYSKGFCTLRELGLAMINVATHGCDKNIIEGKDIIELAKKTG